jgi:hypothetical protein
MSAILLLMPPNPQRLVREMEESTEIGHEMVTEVMEKARHVVSFAVTPVAKRPRLTSVVSKVLALEGAVKLEDKFEVEIKSGDEGDFNLEKLKALMGEESTKVEANATTFTPSVLQWNSIVQPMFVITAKVEKVCEAVAVLADVSEHRFEFVDDQVVHLRGSIGSRPRELGPNVPGFNLWTNVTKLADDVAGAIWSTQPLQVTRIPLDLPSRRLTKP